MRPRAPRPGSLTSMIDVLFILVFASLAYAQSRPEQAEPPRPRQPAAPPVDAAPAEAPDAAALAADAAAPAIDYAALRERAIERAVQRLEAGGTLVLRVSAEGVLTAIEAGPDDRLEVEVPLLEGVPDPDVERAYLGDRNPDLQLCSAAARYRDTADRLVVIAPARELADLEVALVEGLLRDLARCEGLAVIVEPQPGGSDE